MKSFILVILTLILVPAQALALSIVTTTADLGAIAREVAGPDAKIEVVAKPTQDPHYVDARPSLALSLNKADLVVVNGVELEVGWLPGLLKAARNPKVLPGAEGYFDASTAVTLLEVVAKADRAQGDIHPGGNPHFLHDPRAAARVAVALADRLAKLDPAKASAYQERGQKFAAAANLKAEQWQQKFQTLPANRRAVVAYHASLTYLFDWLAIDQATTVEPKPGIQPNPGHVAKVLQTMRQRGLNVIVQEAYYPTKTSQTLAQMAKGKLVVIPGGTADGQTYLDRVDQTAKGVFDALAH
jgi:zinc/manganese transport system substrate-binding protein